ncbi:MAG: thioredoxin-like domain-containing protein [Planctomycetota bacterium]
MYTMQLLRPTVVALALITPTLLLAQTTAPGSAATPSTQPATARVPLTMAELEAKPALVPPTTTLANGIRVDGGREFPAGTKVKVLEIENGRVVAELPGGVLVALRPEQTTILADAEKLAGSVSPEAAALTYAELAQRRELWPTQVTLQVRIELSNGVAFDPGTTLDLSDLTATHASVLTPDRQGVFTVTVQGTDVMSRALQALAGETPVANGALAAELSGKLIDANGNPVELGDEVQYIGVYFAAGWCPACAEFTPQLVDFYGNARQRSDNFEMILVPLDRSERDAMNYMRKANMPWPSVRFGAANDLPVARATRVAETPQLVIMDREGRVIQDSHVDGRYIGPVEAARTLQRLALSGR